MDGLQGVPCGLTCVVGGGEAPDVTPTYSSAVKTKLAMHWAAGERDTAANASDGFDGRGAATYGENWFRGKGFTKTSLQIVAGKPHDTGNQGAILAAQLDLHLP